MQSKTRPGKGFLTTVMSQHSWLPQVPENLVKLKIRCGFLVFSTSFLLHVFPSFFLSFSHTPFIVPEWWDQKTSTIINKTKPKGFLTTATVPCSCGHGESHLSDHQVTHLISGALGIKGIQSLHTWTLRREGGIQQYPQSYLGNVLWGHLNVMRIQTTILVNFKCWLMGG